MVTSAGVAKEEEEVLAEVRNGVAAAVAEKEAGSKSRSFPSTVLEVCFAVCFIN